MKLFPFFALAITLGAVHGPVFADEPAPRMLVEIYRIAPGQHEAFVRGVASYDEANRLAGLPPRQLYVHQDGASWDFMLIQPASIPPEKSKALEEAWKKLGLPTGARFFVEFRQHVAEHSDTFVEGPTTAAAWLRKLEAK